MMQPRTDILNYRSESAQWRIWNVTENDFPPYSLVSLERGSGVALTAFITDHEVQRHIDDILIDRQITYRAKSGPVETPNKSRAIFRGAISRVGGDTFSQTPDNFLATFDCSVRKDGNGLATQHWPVLVRYTGDLSEIPDSWPRYAIPDLENYGVKYDEFGIFQIMGIDKDSINVPLVWIAPRHIAYRDAWAIGAVDLIEGTSDPGHKELMSGIEAVNSPGGGDILTIEDGRIVAHYGGMYRCNITAIANGSIDGSDNFRLAFNVPVANNAQNDIFGEIPFPPSRGTTTGSYGWLPVGINGSEGHNHDLGITGGASTSRFWDRMTTTINYTSDFRIQVPQQLPLPVRLMWNGGEGESLSRVRYSIEYMGPNRSSILGFGLQE
jgi:hypothetical protein